MINFLDDLRHDAWVTSGDRYAAARRLRRRELFATVSLALFSSLSVAIAFIQRIYVENGSPTDNYLTALSACLGILLLAISLMEWGMANGAKAEALHQNAEDLNAFRRKVALMVAEGQSNSATITRDLVEKSRVEYENIKLRCRFNHEPLDDDYVRASRRLDAPFLDSNQKPRIGRLEKVWICFLWYWKSVWYLSLFWGAIAIALYFALPKELRDKINPFF